MRGGGIVDNDVYIPNEGADVQLELRVPKQLFEPPHVRTRERRLPVGLEAVHKLDEIRAHHEADEYRARFFPIPPSYRF